MKAVLVMDMPESCSKCPLIDGNDECIMQDEDANFNADTWDDLKAGCPLRELPKRKRLMELDGIITGGNISAITRYVVKTAIGLGWNACIDAIVEK